MKKKTEMQKFVESLEDFVDKHNVKNIDKYPGSMAISLIEVIIEEAKKRLESEKHQIMEAYMKAKLEHIDTLGLNPVKNKIIKVSEDYYNETYGGDK